MGSGTLKKKVREIALKGRMIDRERERRRQEVNGIHNPIRTLHPETTVIHSLVLYVTSSCHRMSHIPRDLRSPANDYIWQVTTSRVAVLTFVSQAVASPPPGESLKEEKS